MANKFDKIFNEYLDFLKEKKIYKKDLAIEYEHNVQLHNWKPKDDLGKLNSWFKGLKKSPFMISTDWIN